MVLQRSSQAEYDKKYHVLWDQGKGVLRSFRFLFTLLMIFPCIGNLFWDKKVDCLGYDVDDHGELARLLTIHVQKDLLL